MPMPAHMKVVGNKQGEMKGGCKMKGREGSILVEAFNHEVRIPIDIQTGLGTGKRIHNAMSIVKEVDEATPLLYAALCSNEKLNDVEIKWYRVDPNGKEEHYFTHKLEDANICSIRPWMPNCQDQKTESYSHLEEVSFTYRKITWTFVKGGITAGDDWEAPL
jgi:type VI secretion system secreted protein Hcp